MRWSLITLFVLQVVTTQAQTDTTRKLWDTALLEKKTYRVATPDVPVAGVTADRVVGITLWKLHAPVRTDSGERLLVHQGATSEEWVPSRVAADTRFEEGDRVRLSVEAARPGYLYVVDREQYANGTLGEPYLIFPTRLTRGGDNQIRPGGVVEIPAQSDDPPYFRLRRSRPDQAGESLSVIVSPKPIDGIEIGDQPRRVSDAEFASWMKAWGEKVGRLDMQNSVGQLWSKAEREAGSTQTRSLKQDEPHPQSLYYRPSGKVDEAVMVGVALRYALK